jgi:hypothetical protein
LRPVSLCRAAPETAQEDASSQAPADSPEYGRQTYKPETYNELLGDAANAMVRALGAGVTRMEVEFPAVPTTDCAHLSIASTAMPRWLSAIFIYVYACFLWGWKFCSLGALNCQDAQVHQFINFKGLLALLSLENEAYMQQRILHMSHYDKLNHPCL